MSALFALIALLISSTTSQDEQTVIWSDDMNNSENWQTSIYFGGQENGHVEWTSNNEKCTDNGICAAVSEAGIKRLTNGLYQNMGVTFDYVFECNDFSPGSSCYMEVGYSCLDEDPATLRSYSNHGWPRIRGTEHNNLQHRTANFSLVSECNNKPFLLIKFNVHFTTAQTVYLDNINFFENMNGYSDANTVPMLLTSTSMPDRYALNTTRVNTAVPRTSSRDAIDTLRGEIEVTPVVVQNKIEESDNNVILYVVIIALCAVILGLIIGFVVFCKSQKSAKYSKEIQTVSGDDSQYEGMLTNTGAISEGAADTIVVT